MDIDTRLYTRGTVVLGRSSLRNVLRKGFFSPSRSAVAPNGEQLRPPGKPTPRPGHAKLLQPGCEGPGGAGQPRSSVGYQPNMVQEGTPKDRGSFPTPVPDEMKGHTGISMARPQASAGSQHCCNYRSPLESQGMKQQGNRAVSSEGYLSAHMMHSNWSGCCKQLELQRGALSMGRWTCMCCKGLRFCLLPLQEGSPPECLLVLYQVAVLEKQLFLYPVRIQLDFFLDI
ncbi:uncharacterized protein [Patagioenas fasciata]|uniref:uncharacterized protein n=1 Tax=Patagioenas fasciata TaxID=372321 RepID=UPI003A99FA40